ncbi:MAG: site-specific DNA-methyltransferase [Clostridiales bacterium]|nr:site-specific DNA-methyltransferase [Clostridiales bacterium]
MIWHRSHCVREINDQQQEGGLLICQDALDTDLSAFVGQAQMIYLDPPGTTGNRFDCKLRVGKKGWESSRQAVQLYAYSDDPSPRDEGHLSRLRKLLLLSNQLLNETGSLFLHVDVDNLARARLMMDEVFGEKQFRNQIIWSYQTGGRSKRYFSRKHDAILFYAKSDRHYFDITQVPVAKRGSRDNHLKRHVDEHGRSYRSIQSGGKKYIYYDDEPVYPDDVWADVSQMQQKDPQRTGYPGQKPQALLDRMLLSTTKPGDLVMDLCCGSGTTLASAAAHGRHFVGIDKSRVAFAVCRKRLAPYRLVCQAPLSESGAMLDAAAVPGIGFYTVSINAYTVPEEELQGLTRQPRDLHLEGLDLIDQWHAGLINKGVFTAYASALRSKQTPELDTSLEVPLLRGTVAILLIDVLGRRSLWTGSPAL